MAHLLRAAVPPPPGALRRRALAGRGLTEAERARLARLPRYSICPLCHGIHKAIPECLGRPQTPVEWMVDRGVRPERAREIEAARLAAGLGSIVLPPDPRTLNVPPYGRPETPPERPPDPPAEHVQEALF